MADREEMRHRIVSSLTELFVGTEWAPPDGGIIVDAVVVMGWVEPSGDSAGISWFGANNGAWVSEGLLRDALRSIEQGGAEPDDG